jgi:pimeloyl-ACP methyl ester carboxylesterase
MLATQRFPAADGAGAAPPLWIVHGLFGSRRNWAGMARRLAARRPVVTADLRNHGESPWRPTHGYGDLAADLAATLAAAGEGPVDLLGHSMGGKAAMRLALAAPGRVGRLIVADIAPVAYGHAAENRHWAEAMLALDLTPPLTRAEADRRLARQVADPGLRAFFLQSLDLAADPPRWRLNLPVLAGAMEAIVGWEPVAGAFAGRTLFLSGGDSGYVRPEHRAAIRALFPQARFARLPGAGHWLHADRPQAFAETVEVFLAG